MHRLRETLIAVIAVGAVVAVIVLATGGLGGSGNGGGDAGGTGDVGGSSVTAGAQDEPDEDDDRLPSALAVKVDNAADARPHTGLSGADAVVVEPVEGGLTRLVALFWGERPDVVGPVRSARETDIDLLGQIHQPVLAYSGAASRLQPHLDNTEFDLRTPHNTPGAFHRTNRPSPHNLYAKVDDLPPTERTGNPLTSTDAPPAGGDRTNTHTVSYDEATYRFRWSAGPREWAIALDGSPLTSTERGRLSASSVVVQEVEIGTGLGIPDSMGNVSPVAETVGSGDATVLRDGRAFDATWARTSVEEPTTYRTAEGVALPLADGPVWVLLVPA